METKEISEGEVLKQELLIVLQKVGVSGSLEKGYVSNKQVQKDAINKLPDNLVQQLRAIYLARNLKDNPSSHGIIAGEVTEVLTKSSLEEKPSALSNTLLELMQNPKRFNLNGWSPLMQSDTLYLRVNTKGGIVIKEAGEVKKGQFIDRRAVKQLGKDGFQRSFTEITRALRGDEIKNHPMLSSLYGKRVVLAPDFVQKLFITADKQISTAKDLLHHRDQDDQASLKVLQSVTVEKIPFSRKEIDVISSYLWEKI